MEKLKKRKLIRPVELIIIVVLVVGSVAALILLKQDSPTQFTAQISYDGKVVKEINLNISSDTTFRLKENEKVGFQITDKKIRFFETDCPDKLCENFGYLKHVNEVAICLPNRVSLKLVSENQDIDSIVN